MISLSPMRANRVGSGMAGSAVLFSLRWAFFVHVPAVRGIKIMTRRLACLFEINKRRVSGELKCPFHWGGDSPIWSNTVLYQVENKNTSKDLFLFERLHSQSARSNRNLITVQYRLYYKKGSTIVRYISTNKARSHVFSCDIFVCYFPSWGCPT